MQLRVNTTAKHFVKKCFQLKNLIGIISLFLLYLMVIRTSYDSTKIEQSGKDDSSVVVEKTVKSGRGSEGERKKISINISNLKLEAVKNIPLVTPHKCIETAALHKGEVKTQFTFNTCYNK